MELESPDILVVIPTKAQSKCMMRHKGKEQVEEGNSLTKVTQKRKTTKVKEIQKCCNGSEWDPKSDNGQSEPV